MGGLKGSFIYIKPIMRRNAAMVFLPVFLMLLVARCGALTRYHTDPDELIVPNERDFESIELSVTDGDLQTEIIFYDSMDVPEFFYYFSTDDHFDAEICVRCRPDRFVVAEETGPGWYNTIVYEGIPTVTDDRYHLDLPWATIFGGVDAVDLWLFSMLGQDRLPDMDNIELSWWSLVTCSRSEPTLYHGDVDYKPTPAGWWMRCDGEVNDQSQVFFPDIDTHTPSVSKLLAAIGSPTNSTWDDNEIWNRVVSVWSWLQDNQLTAGDNYAAAMSYITSLGGWPSLAEIAYMYETYGGIWWGTCMSRAQLLATLLYAVGIPPDKFAIAEAYWKPSYSQHMYVIIYLSNHWFYVDPTYISEDLSAGSMSSVGSGSADYAHPLKIKLLPGSSLFGVPLVE
jgi:hypothetical protein